MPPLKKMMMYRTFFIRLLLAALIVLSACSEDDAQANNPLSNNSAADTSPDATTDVSDVYTDASDARDADGDDTGPDADADADASPSDDATEDVADDEVPLAGFGDITGECGVLDDELITDDSYYVVNHIDFGADPYDDSDESELTDGGREIIADGNAGGSSVLSEVFAYEVLERCELASFLKSETEISYTTSDSKLTDILVEIDTLKIGVSVTRAVGWPRDDPYTVEQAQSLLEDKLLDIQDSSANVAPEDAWKKQILHVIAYEDEHAASLETAYGQLDASVKADSVVFVTVSDGDDAFLY